MGLHSRAKLTCKAVPFKSLKRANVILGYFTKSPKINIWLCHRKVPHFFYIFNLTLRLGTTGPDGLKHLYTILFMEYEDISHLTHWTSCRYFSLVLRWHLTYSVCVLFGPLRLPSRCRRAWPHISACWSYQWCHWCFSSHLLVGATMASPQGVTYTVSNAHKNASNNVHIFT